MQVEYLFMMKMILLLLSYTPYLQVKTTRNIIQGGGINGYALKGRRVETATDGSQVARIPVLQPNLTLMETNGTTVLSRGTPIHRGYNLDGSISLLVKKDL